MNRTFTKIWRFTLLITVPIAIFWLVFYFWQGYVPAPSTIGFFTKDLVIFKLSFGISRWFDILIGPLWVVTLICWSNYTDMHNDEPSMSEVFQFVAWAVTFICAFDAVGAGIATGFVTNVIAVLVIELAAVLARIVVFFVRWAGAN